MCRFPYLYFFNWIACWFPNIPTFIHYTWLNCARETVSSLHSYCKWRWWFNKYQAYRAISLDIWLIYLINGWSVLISINSICISIYRIQTIPVPTLTFNLYWCLSEGLKSCFRIGYTGNWNACLWTTQVHAIMWDHNTSDKIKAKSRCIHGRENNTSAMDYIINYLRACILLRPLTTEQFSSYPVSLLFSTLTFSWCLMTRINLATPTCRHSSLGEIKIYLVSVGNQLFSFQTLWCSVWAWWLARD